MRAFALPSPPAFATCLRHLPSPPVPSLRTTNSKTEYNVCIYYDLSSSPVAAVVLAVALPTAVALAITPHLARPHRYHRPRALLVTSLCVKQAIRHSLASPTDAGVIPAVRRRWSGLLAMGGVATVQNMNGCIERADRIGIDAWRSRQRNGTRGRSEEHESASNMYSPLGRGIPRAAIAAEDTSKKQAC
ncbi:hypothetical protein GY45DRAFT_519349 [Cubamyces sp. BRFM 1775]|nr:hypothetical protein GY45DRAFT_519349 [Cubamyces sp. BRFM 1775]